MLPLLFGGSSTHLDDLADADGALEGLSAVAGRVELGAVEEGADVVDGDAVALVVSAEQLEIRYLLGIGLAVAGGDALGVLDLIVVVVDSVGVENSRLSASIR